MRQVWPPPSRILQHCSGVYRLAYPASSPLFGTIPFSSQELIPHFPLQCNPVLGRRRLVQVLVLSSSLIDHSLSYACPRSKEVSSPSWQESERWGSGDVSGQVKIGKLSQEKVRGIPTSLNFLFLLASKVWICCWLSNDLASQTFPYLYMTYMSLLIINPLPLNSFCHVYPKTAYHSHADQPLENGTHGLRPACF